MHHKSYTNQEEIKNDPEDYRKITKTHKNKSIESEKRLFSLSKALLNIERKFEIAEAGDSLTRIKEQVWQAAGKQWRNENSKVGNRSARCGIEKDPNLIDCQDSSRSFHSVERLTICD